MFEGDLCLVLEPSEDSIHVELARLSDGAQLRPLKGAILDSSKNYAVIEEVGTCRLDKLKKRQAFSVQGTVLETHPNVVVRMGYENRELSPTTLVTAGVILPEPLG